jgi:hypothetical protein
MAETLSYAHHRRFHPWFHFFVIPVLAIHFVMQLWLAVMHPLEWRTWWSVVVASALLSLAFIARVYPLRIQDRVIRLEETLRLARVLPAGMQPRIADLSSGDLIGLRFAPDAELPDLVRSICAGECKGREQVKQRIKGVWRADKMRI